jgi:hypothetical protein
MSGEAKARLGPGVRVTRYAAFLLSLAMLFGPPRAAADELSPQVEAPPARLSPADHATEYWSLTARFDEGYRLFARLGITNEGPGEQTAGALWYLVFPDGRVAEFRNGRMEGRWRLSPDRRRIDIASSSLDLHGPLRRLAIDSDSQKAKISLQFPAHEIEAWPADRSPGAFRTDALQIDAPVEGTIRVGKALTPIPVHGRIALMHTWLDKSVPTLVQQVLEFVGATPDVAVYLSDFTTPDGAHGRWLVLQRNGAAVYQSTDIDVQLEPADATRSDDDRTLPGGLLVQDAHVRLEIRTQRQLLRTNPLKTLPQPFRYLFARSVDPQWVWADASFQVELKDVPQVAPLAASGSGTLSVTGVNPPRARK